MPRLSYHSIMDCSSGPRSHQPVACEYYYLTLTSDKAIVPPESNSPIINLVCNPESLLTDVQNANSIPSQGFR